MAKNYQILDRSLPPARENLSTYVERSLRDALMAGKFKPGERLNIRSLALALGTSPTPVREALSRLAAEGAVEISPGRSAVVPPFDVTRFEEIYDIRLILEQLAAERATERHTKEDLRQLSTALAEYKSAASTGDIEGALEFNKVFRFALYSASKMPALVSTIGAFWTQSAPYFHLIYQLQPRDPDLEECYDAVVSALENRDSAGCRDAIRRSIEIGAARLRAVSKPLSKRRAKTKLAV